MKTIRDFMKKHPLILAVSGLLLLWVSVRIIPFFNAGALNNGVNEVKAAVIVLLVYWLLTGRKRDLRPDLTGFSYGFRVMRYVYIILFAGGLIGLISIIIAIAKNENVAGIGLSLADYILLTLAVGIVEEFTCRAMLFGGLVQVFKPTRKGVILAAIVSGIAFGFIHVAKEVFTGEITNSLGVFQVIGKTVETGMFGFALAIIYFRNRSIWSVAALHGMFDFLILFATISQKSTLQGYVQTDGFNARATGLVNVFMALLLIPAVLRTLKEIKKEPEPYCCPGDEAFAPRSLAYVKNRKKSAAE